MEFSPNKAGIPPFTLCQTSSNKAGATPYIYQAIEELADVEFAEVNAEVGLDAGREGVVEEVLVVV